MNEIMKDEVYLFENLDQLSVGENMTYLKCIVYIRPTSENITLLCQEFQRPRYGSYFICEFLYPLEHTYITTDDVILRYQLLWSILVQVS